MPAVDHDVVIVGYGPVGAVLANLLGQAGVTTLVVEPTRDVYHLPRAAHFDDEIMRVFQGLGLAEAVLPVTTPVRGMDFVTASGEVLFGFVAAGRPRRHGWEAGYMFYQPDLERALRHGVTRFPSVVVDLGNEVTALDPRDDDVALEVRDVDTGAARSVRAHYVIGCDGARSFVRKSLGIGLDDLGFDQDWLVVDTMLRPEADPALPDRVLQICDPARPATFVPSAGAHRRWELMAVGDETADDLLDPATIERLLAPWVAVGVDVVVVRAAVYSFHALVAHEWRRGRVLLAGDAAHQMPPFLGQGMCSGVRDAANLAWKLTMVLCGSADNRLLDTYQPEREPHVRAITEQAVTLGSILQTTDPHLAARRDEGFRTSDDPVPVAGLPPLGPSPLVHGGSCAGRPHPQRVIGDDDRLGSGFAVVGPLAETARLDDLHPAIVSADDGPTVIVRPDRYTFAECADETSLRAAERALREALGRQVRSVRT